MAFLCKMTVDVVKGQVNAQILIPIMKMFYGERSCFPQ